MIIILTTRVSHLFLDHICWEYIQFSGCMYYFVYCITFLLCSVFSVSFKTDLNMSKTVGSFKFHSVSPPSHLSKFQNEKNKGKGPKGSTPGQ